MIFDFQTSDIIKEVTLSNKFKILLFDCSGKYKDLDAAKRSRNIYAINDNRIVWRVVSNSDEMGWPFLDIFEKDRELHALRWDDCEYRIDIETGKATSIAFLK